MAVGVAVVIPVRNGELHVASAIDSCLSQTIQLTEIVVVDDGSEDNTARIATSFGSRVRLVRQNWSGAATAMNTGVTETTSPFVSFLDHDDLWSSEKIATQMREFELNPALDAVFGHLVQFVSPEVEASLAARLWCPTQPQPGICASVMLIRREALAHFGPFEGGRDASAFMKWQVRARMNGFNFAVPDAVLVRRRIHAMNSSRVESALNRELYLNCARELILNRRRTKGR
jgi:glycosyltransferase involved in cell wall biosynthesis